MSKAIEFREQAAAKFKAAHDLVDGKDPADLSAETEEQFTRIMAEAADLDAKYQKAAQGDEKVGTLRDRMDYYHGKATGNPVNWSAVQMTASEKAKGHTLGDQFVHSEQYEDLRKSGALESDNARFKSEYFRAETKAPGDIIGSGAGPGGALVTPQYIPGVLELPQRPRTVRDLFSNDTTDSDLLSYARQSAFDNAAAPVAQAVSTITGAKPQSSIAWTRVTTPVETIATFMAATRRQLADAGQTRALIDNQLRLMLDLVEEDQLVNGNGTSPNLRGLLNTTGVQTLDYSANASTNALLNLDGFREAKRLVLTGAARARPDGVIVNPVDAAIIDERKDTQNRYLGNGPFGTGPETLWGMPRIESEAVATGKAIVGAFKVGATVFIRQDTAVYVSDSHSDWFVRNLIAVLGERREALAVYFPAAFVYFTLKAWA